VRRFKVAVASTPCLTTPSNITSASVGLETFTERIRDLGRSYRTRTGWTYIPDIQFDNVVGGAKYSSNQRALGGKEGFNSRDAADAVVEKYPVGHMVTVYYDPEDPKEAVLEPSLNRSLVPRVVGCPIIALGGLGVFWLAAQMMLRA